MTQTLKNTAKTPVDLALYWEQENPNSIYMTQPLGNGQVKTYTWSQALDEARRFASYLKAQGFPEGSHIAMLSKNCASWVIADLGIWMAGYVSVPLYPTLNAETVEYILEHSEAKLVVLGKLDDWESMAAGVPNDLPAVAFDLAPDNVRKRYPKWDEIISESSPIETIAELDEKSLATIVYTSGSTGKPKGVMLSFESMVIAGKGVGQELNIRADDRILSYLPLSHVFERFVVEMGSLYSGFQLFFAEALDTFLADLNRARPTLFMSIPRIWTKFQAGIFSKMPKKKVDLYLKFPILSGIVKRKILTKLGLENVRFAGSGSAPLSAETIGWYRSLGLELLEGYGMSENFAFSHMSKPGRSKLGYVGEALPGVECKIADNGEILVKSPATMMGYFKDEEKTKETFDENGFLKTGDRGEIDDEGRLKITGRTKEIFKTSKGKYVAPAPIENKVISHPDLEVVCVAGAECPQPHALAMLSEDAFKQRNDAAYQGKLISELSALLVDVNATLDPHEHLEFITVVSEQWGIENGYLTPTMKLKRDVVESAYKAQIDDWYAVGKKQKVIFE